LGTRRVPTVVDRDGTPGTIREFAMRDGREIAVVELARDTRVLVPAELLHAEEDDRGYSITARWSHFAREAPLRLDIPLLREDLAVTRQARIAEQIRVRRRVVREDRELATAVWTERIETERVPRDELVDELPRARQEGDTLVVPIVEEVPVVTMRLRLREELRIRVVREPSIDRRRVVVRRHELELERVDLPNNDKGENK
jgi:stress response protein YsnF